MVRISHICIPVILGILVSYFSRTLHFYWFFDKYTVAILKECDNAFFFDLILFFGINLFTIVSSFFLPLLLFALMETSLIHTTFYFLAVIFPSIIFFVNNYRNYDSVGFLTKFVFQTFPITFFLIILFGALAILTGKKLRWKKKKV